MKNLLHIIALALLVSACSSHKTITDIVEIPASSDPLSFVSGTAAGDTQTKATTTNPLTTGFLVQCWKAFGTAAEYPVMSDYVVEYKTSGSAWDGTVRNYWDYTCVEGQYEKYWDYSAFPYRFHAIAPCPGDIAGFEASRTHLTIPAAYSGQTCHNGMLKCNNPLIMPANAEPYMVAQVQRNSDGRDYDLLIADDDKEINKQSTTRNRYVALPFHHLNTKVRFGVYCTSPWVTANCLYIDDLRIYIASHDFVTAAGGYSADDDPVDGWRILTGTSGFTDLDTDPVDYHRDLLRFDGGRDVPGNDLRLCQGRSSAFFLQCPGGMAQIPQEDVRMCVSLKLMREDGTLYHEFTDIPVRLENEHGGYDLQFDWISGYIQTYYLVLGDIDDKLEIEFTCTLTPWEDVSGSLNTDLEK